MTAHRDDFRLGAPTPTGPALDHLCPVCEGEGDAQVCYCGGLGVITAAQAAGFAETSAVENYPDPRWQARPLAPVPAFTGHRCGDCAFRPDSPERDGLTAGALYRRTQRRDAAFYCHAGMHHGEMGYVPRQRDARGAPIGHPICAGWLQQHRKATP